MGEALYELKRVERKFGAAVDVARWKLVNDAGLVVVGPVVAMFLAVFLVRQADALRGEGRAGAVTQKAFKSVTVVGGNVNGCIDGKAAVAAPGEHVACVFRFEEVVYITLIRPPLNRWGRWMYNHTPGGQPL